MAVLSLGYSAEKVKKGKRLLLKNIILKGWEGNDHAK